MDKRSVIKSAKRYAGMVCSRFPVKKIILFGSFARGKPREDSDIDIAVIFQDQPASLLETEAELYRIGREIDARIEPIIVEEKFDPAGFLEEISRYGKVVFSAG